MHERPSWAHVTISYAWLRTNHNTRGRLSGGLNAIEYNWVWMNNCIRQHHPRSQEHLGQLVAGARNEISPVCCASMHW